MIVPPTPMTGLNDDASTIGLAGGVAVATRELRFTSQTSSGPGGQNVNRVRTRVTLTFDLANSPSLTAQQKARIRRKLSTRVNRNGVLRVVASSHRTQAANRRAATERFGKLMSQALERPKPRMKTRPPPAAKRKRREDKLHRGKIKQQRRGHWDVDR